MLTSIFEGRNWGKPLGTGAVLYLEAVSFSQQVIFSQSKSELGDMSFAPVLNALLMMFCFSANQPYLSLLSVKHPKCIFKECSFQNNVHYSSAFKSI